MSHISLKDIAAKAGVSYPTICKVLQGKGTVSSQTRANILQAAEALGYVPNVVARSLISQKTSTIGVVVSDSGGYKATRTLLERVPDLTAIYVQNDVMAVGVLSALHDLGVRVPDDCSVIGCDDIPLSTYTFPPLTTMHLPFGEIGEMTVKLLLDLITQCITEPQKMLLPTYLVSRNTSGPCR